MIPPRPKSFEQNLPVGFTGTALGCINTQKAALLKVLDELQPYGLHHGDCIGADEQAHCLMRLFYPSHPIYIHPPDNHQKRAWCGGPKGWVYYENPLPYLDRNHVIVNDTRILIACPKGTKEELRSGTWATVRYARKLHRAIVFVYPKGTVKWEKGD